METEPVLGLLGLSRRAGKLACGEEAVREMAATGKCRAVFLAADAGDSTRRKVMRHDEKIPVFVLSCGRETLGQAIGMPGCAVCAVNDIGIAGALAVRLADTSPVNQQAAERVSEKKERIDRRKGKKKKR